MFVLRELRIVFGSMLLEASLVVVIAVVVVAVCVVNLSRRVCK